MKIKIYKAFKHLNILGKILFLLAGVVYTITLARGLYYITCNYLISINFYILITIVVIVSLLLTIVLIWLALSIFFSNLKKVVSIVFYVITSVILTSIIFYFFDIEVHKKEIREDILAKVSLIRENKKTYVDTINHKLDLLHARAISMCNMYLANPETYFYIPHQLDSFLENHGGDDLELGIYLRCSLSERENSKKRILKLLDTNFMQLASIKRADWLFADQKTTPQKARFFKIEPAIDSAYDAASKWRVGPVFNYYSLLNNMFDSLMHVETEKMVDFDFTKSITKNAHDINFPTLIFESFSKIALTLTLALFIITNMFFFIPCAYFYLDDEKLIRANKSDYNSWKKKYKKTL